MHGMGLLHGWLVSSRPEVHLAHVGALVEVVGGLLHGGKLARGAFGGSFHRRRG